MVLRMALVMGVGTILVSVFAGNGTLV